MRVAVLGGTIFVGRAVTEALVAAGHDVLVVHRGTHEPDDLVAVDHLHVERAALVEHAAELARWAPDAVVDTSCGSAPAADAALAVIGDARCLVLSSMDVYEAYGGLHAHRNTASVPITEESPTRAERYPYRGKMPGADDYEKQDVEERYLARGATVCRLPIVYGPRDYQRREWSMLHRVVAGRHRIPRGAGNLVISRGEVHEIARGVLAALGTDAAVGEVFNLCESGGWPIATWWSWILDDAAAHLGVERPELVQVPEHLVPEDLGISAAGPQHLLVDPTKAANVLGWHHPEPRPLVEASVRWHLDHPPAPGDEADDWSADDLALTGADAVAVSS